MKFTKIATPEQIDQKWVLIDAEGKTFGRIITEVATILRGKNKLLEKNPEKLYKLATRGMLPKTKLGAKMLKKLKIYAGAEHPHTAQLAK